MQSQHDFASQRQNSASQETSFRVRYAETDQMGVAYHANYLIWMEIGRVELVRSIGLSYGQIEVEEGLFLSVVDVSCRYLYPARYDQQIRVETCVRAAHSRMLEFDYRIYSADPEKLLAEGSTRHIWLNRQMRPSRLPLRYLAILQGSLDEMGDIPAGLVESSQ